MFSCYINNTMATLVDSSLFDNFGPTTYQQIFISGFSCIQDATYSDNSFDVFSQFCNNVLTNSDIDFNCLQLHNLVYHLINQNPTLVDNTIIQAFDKTTCNINEQISELIKNDLFTIASFIEIYKKYYTRAKTLTKYLVHFDTKVITDTNNNNQMKHSHIGLIRSFLFYKNVINSKYTTSDNKEYYLYEIFNKAIENNVVSMEEIIQLFKMYSFYIRLSYVAKTNKDKLFNTEINKLFLVTLGSNEKFVQTVTQYIDNTIKILTTDKNKSNELNNKSNKNTEKNTEKTTENNLDELIGLVSNHFLEKDLFNMYYEQYFEMRLMNTEINSELEKKLISKFKKPIDNKIIQNMIYKLEDVEAMKNDRILYEKLHISITSEKYKNKIDITKINPTMINTKLFRSYAWSYTRTSEQDQMSIPFELCPYIDIYNKFYECKYPYRDIVWNFNNGVAAINLTLGLKTYKVQLATPQLFLLLQFNEKEVITATELATNMGIPMAKLGIILNSLIRANILKRETGTEKSNPEMKLMLNKNFTYAIDTPISIVKLMDSPQKQKKQEAEIMEKFASGRETILQACIVRTMKQTKHMTYGDLFSRVKVSIPFQIEETKFTEVLKSCENESYVKNNGDGSYNYIEDDNVDVD